MKRLTLAGTICGWLFVGMAVTSSAQNSRHAPKIPHPGDKTLGAELVLWTPTQEPKPVSGIAPAKPALATDKKVEVKSPETSTARSSISEDLVGEVVKAGDTYALTTPESETYILE